MGRCVPRKALSQYLDGELAPGAAEEFGRHVAECPDCAAALDEMRAVETVVRRQTMAEGVVPDVAARVTGDLRRRGEFLLARIAARRRRLFGGRSAPLRAAAVLALAAVILVVGVAALDYATQRAWARRTEPVLADAERVLVRLTLEDLQAEAESEALQKARD